MAARQVLNRARPTTSRFPPCNPVSGSASASPYIPAMPRSKIDATLDLMTLEELSEVHRYIEVWQRAGYMGSQEATA